MAWYPLGKDFLLLNLTTGSATHFDGGTFEHKQLLPDLELRQIKSYEMAKKKGLKIPAMIKYNPNIIFPVAMGNGVSLVRKISLAGVLVNQCIVIDEVGTVSQNGDRDHLLWEHDGNRLYLDLIEKTFRRALANR